MEKISVLKDDRGDTFLCRKGINDKTKSTI